MINFPLLKIGRYVVEVPIIQGGMGVGISLSGLASSVTKEKAIGVISAADAGAGQPDFKVDPLGANCRALIEEIRKVKKITKGVFGVNVMFAMTHYPELVEVMIKEKVPIIFVGAGVPRKLPGFLVAGSDETELVPIVSSADIAYATTLSWLRLGYSPAAIVVEGPLAGGHLGFTVKQINDPEFSLEKIVCQVIKILKPLEKEYHVSIPVIAAGGIFSGEDIYRFLQLGVKGVQMATRFVTTYECDAPDAFKQAYLDVDIEDKDRLVIIDSPVGMPGRAIRNKFLQDVAAGTQVPVKCLYRCIKTCVPHEVPYCISDALIRTKEGDVFNGLVFAGARAGEEKIKRHVSELIDLLRREYVVAYLKNNG